MAKGVQTQAVSVLDATTLTISSGVVTATQTAHIIAAETGTTDDLDTINVISTVDSSYGSILLLKADTGDTITLKDGTGNINLGSGADFALSGDIVIGLFYDGTNWNDISSSATSFSSPLTTKGDLFTYAAADARLAVGNNAEVLVADSGEATGLKYVDLGMQLIASTAITSNAASVTLSSLGSLGINEFLAWKLVVSGAETDRNSATDPILIQFNSDTTAANYDTQIAYGQGASALAAESIGTLAGIRVASGATGTQSDTGMFGAFEMAIYQPESASDYKHATYTSGQGFATANEGFASHGVGVWESTSAITSITILPENGTTFEVGNANEPARLSVKLYGLY